MATEESPISDRHRSPELILKGANGNTVPAEAKDSSSVGNLVPTDMLCC